MSNIEKQIFGNPLSNTLCIVPSISFGQRNLAILCGCNLELIMARLLATCHLAGNFLGGERRTADAAATSDQLVLRLQILICRHTHRTKCDGQKDIWGRGGLGGLEAVDTRAFNASARFQFNFHILKAAPRKPRRWSVRKLKQTHRAWQTRLRTMPAG